MIRQKKKSCVEAKRRQKSNAKKNLMNKMRKSAGTKQYRKKRVSNKSKYTSGR